jgi:signal transduction histidine kinase
VSILVAVGMLGPLAVIAMLEEGGSRELEQRVLAGRAQSASLMADRLQTQLSLELESLRAVAESGAGRRALREAWVQRHGLFEAVFAVDAQGRVLEREPSSGAAIDGPAALAGMRAGLPAFTGLLPRGMVYALAPTREGGAVGGIVDPRGARLASALKAYKPASGESIELHDGAGRVLASSDPARLLLRAGSAADELVASARVPIAGWQVQIRQPRRLALGLLHELSRDALIACSLALAIALLFARGAARSVTRPISSLTAAAERIRNGDLSHPVPALGDDEVGLLGEALERMRAGLHEAVATLESRVTERTAAVRKLLGQVIHAQEDERRRVARELHDETTQSLASLAMRVHTAAAAAPPGPLRDQLEAASALAVRTLDGVHRMIADLRPSVLDDLGLESAILWYAEKHLEPLGIAVRCEFANLDGRLPAQVETVVFRVVQEALTNVARHAHASTVLVQGGVAGGRVELEVEDDGCGFDPPSHPARDGSGWGLLGMRERVEMLGGELRLDSTPGQGTHLRIAVPLPAPLEAAHG